MQLIWDGIRLVESFGLDMNSIGLMGNYFANAARVNAYIIFLIYHYSMIER